MAQIRTSSPRRGATADRRAGSLEDAAHRERLIIEIVDRLTPLGREHGVAPAELDVRTRAAYAQFTTSRVQDYLAILVERLVRHSLRRPPG